jgi:hypothetical protein
VQAALGRLALVLAVTAAVVGVVGALIGLAADTSIGRAVSVAYYLVGALLIVLGFFAGNRGPLRPRRTEGDEPVAGLFGLGVALRGARRASGEERQDALATAAIFLGVGAWLILLGVIADASVKVV